jgi:endonuclease/exonuclease/phosphatase family metal-dependent hydrolase
MRALTRNLYLGASLDPITGEGELAALPARVDEVWAEVVASDPRGRMEAIAGEIVAAAPDVVAVQEAARWSGPGAAFDLLAHLVAALEARGERYVAAAVAETFGGALPGSRGEPVTFQDRGAILVREGVRIEAAEGMRYAAAVRLAIGGVELEVPRGLASAVLRVDGLRLRVLATHLELAHQPDVAAVQAAQVAELAALVRAEPLPVLLLGDLNARPGVGAHAALTCADVGLTDAALAAGGAGFTCCESRELQNEVSALFERIDHVLVRGLVPLRATQTASRTPAGLWSSDHAGVLVDLAAGGTRSGERPALISSPTPG